LLAQTAHTVVGIVPDVFVVLGLKPGNRRTFQTWVERQVPNVVFEVTSLKTKRNDAITKQALYAQLGVPEYFLYDPEGAYLRPTLQGYRLIDGAYHRIERETDGSLLSQELSLRLWDDGSHLQFFELNNGQRLLSRAELIQAASEEAAAARADAANAKMDAVVERQAKMAALQKANEEAALRQQAEAEVERLKALLQQRGPASE